MQGYKIPYFKTVYRNIDNEDNDDDNDGGAHAHAYFK